MRRTLLTLVIAAFVMVGCGNTPSDTTIADPPLSTAFENRDNLQINQLIDGWKSEVPSEMKNQQIKADSIKEQVYQSTASLQEIAAFYGTLTDKGWHQSTNMPGLKDGIFISGYENGTTTLIVNAIDATTMGSTGIIIYTVKGNT